MTYATLVFNKKCVPSVNLCYSSPYSSSRYILYEENIIVAKSKLSISTATFGVYLYIWHFAAVIYRTSRFCNVDITVDAWPYRYEYFHFERYRKTNQAIPYLIGYGNSVIEIAYLSNKGLDGIYNFQLQWKFSNIKRCSNRY